MWIIYHTKIWDGGNAEARVSVGALLDAYNWTQGVELNCMAMRIVPPPIGPDPQALEAVAGDTLLRTDRKATNTPTSDHWWG